MHLGDLAVARLLAPTLCCDTPSVLRGIINCVFAQSSMYRVPCPLRYVSYVFIVFIQAANPAILTGTFRHP